MLASQKSISMLNESLKEPPVLELMRGYKTEWKDLQEELDAFYLRHRDKDIRSKCPSAWLHY